MKRNFLTLRGAFVFAALLAFHNTAQAGSNDLFQSHVSWKCVGSNNLNFQLTNPRLMNLALSNAMDAPLSPHYKLGLQCNCSNLDMNVIVYDKTTMQTVLTLAAMRTVSYQSDGKIATVSADGRIIKNGLLSGGQLSGQLVVQLDRHQCFKKGTMSITGTLEVETTNRQVTVNLESATLRTSGRQLRPLVMAGVGNYGNGMPYNLPPPATGGISITIIDITGTPPAYPEYGNLDIGPDVVVGFPLVLFNTLDACDGTLTLSASQTTSYAYPLILCTNTVINLSSGSILVVCTNGADPATLNLLSSTVSGQGALELASTPF